MSGAMKSTALLLALLVSTGCGAAPVASCARMEPQAAPSAPPPPPAGKAASESPMQDSARGQEAESSRYPGSAAPSSPNYAQPPPSAAGGLGLAGNLGAMWAQFENAEALTLSAGADCAGACKALKSMQRSAVGICGLSSTDSDKVRCQAAQDRVRAARDRIRNACGQCHDGPSLDPTAPIDSEQ